MVDIFPYFSLENIPARNIWPPIVGRELLSAINGENFDIINDGDESWLIDVARQWQIYSGSEDTFNTENVARQHFFQVTQRQQQFEDLLSEQRCLVILETDQDNQWRLWQIRKIEQSLADLLTEAITQGSAKKIAAKLLITAEKFAAAKNRFETLDFYPPLALDMLSLHNNKPIFIGFMPNLADTPYSLSAIASLQQAFKTTIEQIIAQPAIDSAQVLHYLKIYASSNSDYKILADALQQIFTDTANI